MFPLYPSHWLNSNISITLKLVDLFFFSFPALAVNLWPRFGSGSLTRLCLTVFLWWSHFPLFSCRRWTESQVLCHCVTQPALWFYKLPYLLSLSITITLLEDEHPVFLREFSLYFFSAFPLPLFLLLRSRVIVLGLSRSMHNRYALSYLHCCSICTSLLSVFGGYMAPNVRLSACPICDCVCVYMATCRCAFKLFET